jgi:hypothetical protein
MVDGIHSLISVLELILVSHILRVYGINREVKIFGSKRYIAKHVHEYFSDFALDLFTDVNDKDGRRLGTIIENNISNCDTLLQKSHMLP